MPEKIVISPDYAGKRADIIFTELFTNFSRSQIRKYIKQGDILINEEQFKPSRLLNGGEIATFHIPAPEPIEAEAENIPINIIFQNSDFIVINKPAGIVVHAGAGVSSGTLVNALLFHCSDLSGIGGKIRPGIVHRLDKDTSGIIVAAKNDYSHSHLAGQFKDRTVKKEYLAIVRGVIKEESGSFSSIIGRHKNNRIKMSSNTTAGRDSLTEWMVLKRFRKATLVRVNPKTGRTHQIRVHFSENGFPLLCDSLYGNKKSDTEVDKNISSTLNRHALHAYKLGFNDPREGKYLEFRAEIPDDFNNALNLLEKNTQSKK